MALAELAEQLQIDQLEIIERNRVHEGQELKILGAIGEGKAPTSVPSAASCALEEILRQGREMIQWSSPKPQNGDWHIGRGVAIIMQKSGIPDIDQANCMIKLESDGTFIVHSGGADIGTGLDTVVTKLAAEVLHCPPQDVHVISGDTDHALFDKGAYASSGTCFSGNAARLAAENLREKILFHGAQMLGEPVADVQLATPGVVRGKKGEVSFGDIAHKGETGTGFGSLVGTGSYITPDFAFPYGANFAEVAVNTRTGEIRLDKFYALLDCGTPVNPELALGQIYGATLRAIGHSMSEEIIYDAEGHPLTRDLRSYGAPKIGDIPRDFRAVLVPSDDKVGPFGAKSISEIGVNGAAPAIATAIHDACGIWLRRWHFTPENTHRAGKNISNKWPLRRPVSLFERRPNSDCENEISRSQGVLRPKFVGIYFTDSDDQIYFKRSEGMSDINHAGSDLIFELEDRPPFHQALVGAITHLLAIFVPMVTPR